jgi:hypothetical protein
MAEIGLVEFGKCALTIGKRVMPLYRSKYSKYTPRLPRYFDVAFPRGVDPRRYPPRGNDFRDLCHTIA